MVGSPGEPDRDGPAPCPGARPGAGPDRRGRRRSADSSGVGPGHEARSARCSNGGVQGCRAPGNAGAPRTVQPAGRSFPGGTAHAQTGDPGLSIATVRGIRVGHWTDPVGLTGCTAVLCPPETVGSGEVRGGAPGTRETDLLRPGTLVQHVDAVLITGGSAFGLAAADVVMRFLEEQGIR